jgi:hypothetical protein
MMDIILFSEDQEVLQIGSDIWARWHEIAANGIKGKSGNPIHSIVGLKSRDR